MSQTFWARIDSNNANNPALNLTGDPAFEITFVRSGANGDMLIEYNGGNADPDTKIEIGGVAYEFTFQLSATLPTLAKDGAGQVPDQFEGSGVYIVTVQDYPTAGETTRVAFMPQETATQTEMDAFGVGATALQNVDTTTAGAVCFAKGTLIDTPDGPVPVEHLAAGDLVCTLDHGPQPIVWISYSEHRWPGSPEKILPILISKDAFGDGMPTRDLVVSPQHKILISRATADGPDDTRGILAPAKGLTWMPGIRRMDGKRSISYFHILLNKHEVLLSEGLPSESFFPGPTAMRMLAPTQRAAIFSHFPKLRSDIWQGYGALARQSLTVGLTRKLEKAGTSPVTACSLDGTGGNRCRWSNHLPAALHPTESRESRHSSCTLRGGIPCNRVQMLEKGHKIVASTTEIHVSSSTRSPAHHVRMA